MKKLLIAAMTLSCFALSSFGQDKDLEKKIIGKWCNPYTYETTGKLKGFQFKKGGKCSAINIPSLKLKSWKIDEKGYLIIEGIGQEEDGTWEPYTTREYIALLNSDSLRLVANEQLKLGFLYLNTKIIKKRITPEVASDEKK